MDREWEVWLKADLVEACLGSGTPRLGRSGLGLRTPKPQGVLFGGHNRPRGIRQTQGKRHVKVKTEIRVMLLPAQAPQRWPATGQRWWGAGHLDQSLPRPPLGLRLPALRLRENNGLQSTLPPRSELLGYGCPRRLR